jgi:hypothetical protein
LPVDEVSAGSRRKALIELAADLSTLPRRTLTTRLEAATHGEIVDDVIAIAGRV